MRNERAAFWGAEGTSVKAVFSGFNIDSRRPIPRFLTMPSEVGKTVETLKLIVFGFQVFCLRTKGVDTRSAKLMSLTFC